MSTSSRTYPVAFQGPNFESQGFGEVGLARAVEIFQSLNWNELNDQFGRQAAKTRDVCDPTLWIGQDCDPMLGVSARGPDQFAALLDYRPRTKLFGLFPFKGRKSARAEGLRAADVPTVLERFYAVADNDFSHVLDGIGQ